MPPTPTGLAWEYYPSTQVPNGGGTQQPVSFPVTRNDRLVGNNAHVYADPPTTTSPAPVTRSRPASGARLELPAGPVHAGEPELRPPVGVHLEQERRPQLGGQPRPGGGAGLLLPPPVPRPPAGAPDRVHRGGRQLPGEEPDREGQGRRRRAGTGDGRRVDRPRAPQRRPLQQRELLHATRRQPAGDADVPVPQGRPVTRVAVRVRGERRPLSSTTSTRMGSRAGSSPIRTGSRRSTRGSPVRWAKPGATGTPSTTSSIRDGRSTERPGRSEDGGMDHRGRGHPRAGDRLPGRRALGGRARRGPGAEAVASRTATSAGSPRTRGAQPTARSGARRSGTSAQARRRRRRAARYARDGALAARTLVPRHAQRDPPGRPGRRTATPTAGRSGRSSPTVGWATSRRPSTATT